MSETLILAEVLDLNAAEPLKAELLALRGHDLTLDASAVERLGGLCLQILMSARKTWAADGVNLSLGSASQYWTEQWAALGAPDFNTEGALA
ncbi:STAS domain-containing protein [Brevundimonas sp. PWP3-1b1]|uniref:STAS domain-containing protein n=1 Tax=unclassified Brevundimonas TaxID=2622653 RepID=UPI003CE8867E